jgi:ferredoxin
MADPTDKRAENVPGKFYVDNSCNACGVCSDTAPDFFKMDDDEEYAFVYKQPSTDDEIEECEDAMDNCPEEAIGDDGA